MDRAPYRRVTPPRQRGADYQREYNGSIKDESISHGETLIMQCIICGIIMVLVLIARMTDIAPAASIRGGINQVLSGAETLDELITDVRQFGSDWLGWEWQPAETVTTPDEFYIPQIDFTDELPSYNLEHTALPSTDYTGTYTEYLPPAADDQVSNPTVPEPTVTPGL